MEPGVQRGIKIVAGARFADRCTLEDEERNGEERDARHLLVDVLGDSADRSRRHEQHHEADSDGAEREGNRNAGEQRDQGRAAIEQADGEEAHPRSAAESGDSTWSASWTTSTVMPAAISP